MLRHSLEVVENVAGFWYSLIVSRERDRNAKDRN